MDDVLYLIREIQEQDEAGIFHATEDRQMVFCQIASVTRSEFYNAGRSGLNPDFQATVAQVDYAGQTVAEYAGKTYSVYRTYRVPGTDYMELYLERKGGTNGKEDAG